MHAYIPVFLLVLTVALAQQPTAQICYVTQGRSSGLTNCQAPPFYSFGEIYPLGPCGYSYCNNNVTNNGIAGDSYGHYTNDFDAVPKPRKYVQLIYHSDVQCLNPKNIEFLTDSPCGTETSFYATCNQTHARVIRYYSGCSGYMSQDNTYPLNQCAGGPDKFVMASCGSSTGSAPNTSPAPVPSPSTTPVPSPSTPRTYTPITIRSTPLTCYVNYNAWDKVVPYNVTDASLICARYDFTCPPNNYTNYCTEGSSVAVHTYLSRETCNQIRQQFPQTYHNVVCCDTNYCNGDQTPNANVSLGVTLVPSLLSLPWIVAFVVHLPRIFMNK